MLKNVPLPTKKRYLTVKERELHDLFQKIANFWAVSVKQVATIVGPRVGATFAFISEILLPSIKG